MLYGLSMAREEDVESYAKRTKKAFFPENEDYSFMLILVMGVMDNIQKIDGYLAKTSHNWSIDRISPVDKNIIRIAVYELMYSEIVNTPPIAAINEAIELAKSFGSDQSKAFVNGILDILFKELKGLKGKEVLSES